MLLGQLFVENNIELLFSRYSNMQNIPNRMLMECFLSCNKGSQADVLQWKPCIQANLDN